MRITPLVASLIATLAIGSAQADEAIKWKAIGQPLATGLIQKNIEQPFFENFAENTGLPITVDYKPIDTTGIKDTEQLRVLKSGLFDLVSIRASQNSRDEPALLGLDLVGLNPDYETGRKVADAYFDTLDQRLQKQFRVKLLGVWPFGPQILFCKSPVASFADVKGLKVRVSDQNLAQFVESIGGIPVPMSFAETHQSLSLGVVDCAITGPSSANSAGWTEIATRQIPLGVQMGLNGYGISLKSWNKLDAGQQAKLQTAFDTLNSKIWAYSEELYKDALNCNVGAEPCTTGKKYKLISVEPSDADRQLLKGALQSISLPNWAAVCDKVNPQCSADWKAKVGPVVGLK